MRYVSRRLAKPAGWDDDAAQNMEDVRRFNRRLAPGMRISVSEGGIVLEASHVRMRDLEEAAGSLRCGGLGDAVLRGVRSIRSYAYSGGARRFVGYNAERKVSGRAAKSRARLASAARAQPAADARMPQQYVDRLVCADSEEFLKRIPDNSVDLVFTSPPYNFGLDYEGGGGDAERWEAYFAKLFAVLDECARVLKSGGRMAVNVQPLFSDYVPTHHVVSARLSRSLLWKGEIIWEKNNYNCKYTAWGSWKSPSSPYLKYTWEFVEVFCKDSLKKRGSAPDADISAEDFKKWVYAKWSIAPERRMKEYGHPAMFPEELARRVLQMFSFRNDIVVDPFMGAGTTCAVAKMLGRRYVGIDVSDKYVRTAADRLLATPQG